MSEFTPEIKYVRGDDLEGTVGVCGLCGQAIEGDHIDAGPAENVCLDCTKGIVRAWKRRNDDDLDDDEVEVRKPEPPAYAPCICNAGLTKPRNDPTTEVCTYCKGSYRLEQKEKAELLAKLGIADPTPAVPYESFPVTQTAAMERIVEANKKGRSGQKAERETK